MAASAAPSRSKGAARLATAAMLGLAAALAAYIVNMPGSGLFIVTTWGAGFLVGLIGVGVAGAALFALLLIVPAIVLDHLDGSAGLAWLIGAALAALAGHGGLTGSIVRAVTSLGPRRAWQDPTVRVRVAIALTGLVVLAWAAADLARTPA